MLSSRNRSYYPHNPPLKPASLPKCPQHPNRNDQHECNGSKEPPWLMEEVYILIEIHSKDSANHGGWCQQAGYDGHHLHYFIHAKVNIVDIKVLHAHHNIAIVFAQIIRLDNVVVYVFEIFCSTIIKKLTFAALNAAQNIAHWSDVSL